MLKCNRRPLAQIQSEICHSDTILVLLLKVLIISNSQIVETSSELIRTSSELIRTRSELNFDNRGVIFYKALLRAQSGCMSMVL